MTTVPEAERSTGLDRDGGTELIFDGLTISNGLGWSIDGSTMYLVDSCPPVIHGFAFDAERGTIADGRILVTVAEDVGVPDGMTVDADGDLWVAIYGGGRVQRYSSAGVLLEELFVVPAEQSTSCAFAGAGLNRLYVTTATEGWSDERRRAEPGAVLVYRFDTDARGRRRHFVGGHVVGDGGTVTIPARVAPSPRDSSIHHAGRPSSQGPRREHSGSAH